MPVSAEKLAKLLPAFTGKDINVREFIDKCDRAIKQCINTELDELYEYIRIKITGKAYERIQNREIQDYNTLKKELLLFYGAKGTNRQWELELSICRQRPGESVDSFYQRIEHLCIRVVESGPVRSREETVFYEKNITTKARDCFIYGLNEKLRDILRLKNPKDLLQAYNWATEEEKLRETENQITHLAKTTATNRSDLVCQNCNKIGHTAKNCFRKQRFEPINTLETGSTSESDQYVDLDHQSENSCSQNCFEIVNGYDSITEEITCDECQRIYPIDSSRIRCFFCKKPGHIENKCFKKKAMLAAKTNQNHVGTSNFGERTASTSGATSVIENRSTQTVEK